MLDRFETFTAAISGIYRDILKIERDEMEKFGLKGAYAQYLLALDHRPEGLSAAELCEICDKDKAAVSRIVSELEKKMLISRENASYRAKIRLTEEGAKVAHFVKQQAELAVSLAGRGLTDEARRALYAPLETIAENLRNISRKGLSE